MPTWPTGIVEYGTFNWLRREVAQAMGLPADTRLLDHVDRSRVDSAIESGLNLFYYPNPSMFTIADATEAQKERLRRAPHQWSFLQRTTTVGMVSGKSSYQLPADFAAFIDEPTTSRSGERIAIASASHIRQLLSSSASSGPPKYAAVEPISSDGSTRQRYSMLVYPTPNYNESINVRHGIVPATLSSDLQYPHGGAEHAETVLACCLSVAAERMGGESEALQKRVADRMAASILQDVHHAQPSSEGIWPVDEPDNGLQINRQYLGRLIGRDLGYGPNHHVWTFQQSRMVEEAIKTGLRRVYNPPVLPDEKYPHSWSFLQPVGRLDLVAGQHTYQMPFGFTMAIGGMTYQDEDVVSSPLIRQSGEELVRHRLSQFSDLRGRPSLFAVRMSNGDNDVPGGRSEIIFWPVPDADYAIDYQYRMDAMMVAMNDGDGSVPGVGDWSSTPQGGQVHAQTFIESCLLACDELMKRDTRARTETFYRCLIASVGFDRKLTAGSTMGYNHDHGNLRHYGDFRDYRTNVVTYNGISY